MGPGTKLPSLGRTTYDYLKQTFALQAEGLIDGEMDAFLIETSQDMLQTKPRSTAVNRPSWPAASGSRFSLR